MKTSMQMKAFVRNLSKKFNAEAEVLLRSFKDRSSPSSPNA